MASVRLQLNTRTGKGGGRFCSPLMFFYEYLSKYSFDRRDFFNTCPKINGAPFGAKIEDASIFGGLILSPQSQHFLFCRADAMTGVFLAPPPPPAPAGWTRPVASLRPAATGRVADGGGPMKTNEGPGSTYLHVRHIALKIKMRVCKYYYSNYVLE